MSTIKTYQALCDGIASREGADGAVTVEYVVIIMFVVGLGAALLAFRQEISNFIQNAQSSVSDMINSLSSGAAGASGTSGGLTKEDVLSINWTLDQSKGLIVNSATGEPFPYETELGGHTWYGQVDGEWVQLYHGVGGSK